MNPRKQKNMFLIADFINFLTKCFNMEAVIFYTIFIPMGAMYLHARMFFTLAYTTSIPVGAMYLHARML